MVSDHDRRSRVPSEDRFRREDPPFPPDGGRCPFVTVISRYCLSRFNPGSIGRLLAAALQAAPYSTEKDVGSCVFTRLRQRYVQFFQKVSPQGG